jgi:P2 family phage contractile tail tube protein
MPINVIPERLTDFRVYRSGTDDLKGIADLQLPSLEPLKDTVKGAGILGEYESPTVGHFGSMKLTMNWRTITSDQISLLKGQNERFDCRGAFQDFDAASGQRTTRQVRVVVQGPVMKVDPGKFEQGANSGGSSDIEAMYLKIDIDGRNVFELDKLNYKCVIDGVDVLASIRTALGL